MLNYLLNLGHHRSKVPNLGYMYPLGYICLSERVHLLYSRNKLTLRQKQHLPL